MKKILENVVKVVLPFFFGIFITIILLAVLLPYMASKHEIYKDIILEDLALAGSNKSGELFAIYFSLFIGGCSILIFKYFEDRKNMFLVKEKIKLDFIGVGIILIPSVFILFFKQEINFYLVFIGLLYYIAYFLTNKNALLSKKILILLFSLYLFIMSLKVVSDKVIKNIELIKIDMVFPLTLVSFLLLIVLLYKKNFLNIEKKILLFQIPVPLILLSFLTNEYLLDKQVYKIPQTNNYKIMILLLVIGLLIINIIQYKTKKDKTLILFSSLIIIFILHYYIFPGNIETGDFWHNGEMMNPWHQIVNKRMQLFVEYNGTSGFYGLVSGFFQNIILDGTTFSYNTSILLSRMFFAIIIGTTCYFLVTKEFALVLALFVDIPSYNRPIPLLAGLLILLLPKLIKNRVKWLQIYAIISLFIFFYYPLNGAAFSIGLFPFAMIQLCCSIKEKLWRKEKKSCYFWFLNIILITSFVCLYKFIIEMLKSTLLFSSQVKLTDGLVIYDYSIPSPWFLKFLINDNLKKQIWYIFLCLVIISAVLIFVYFIYYYFEKYKEKNLMSKLDTPIFLMLSSGIIILLINYTYSIVRMDRKSEFARTSSIMVIILGFLLNILLYKYGRKLFSNNLRIVFIGLILGFVSMINSNTIGNEISAIKKFYVIPDSKDFKYVYVEGEKIGLPRLGKGFIPNPNLTSLNIIKQNIDKLAPDEKDFWPSMRRQLLYIFDKKIPVKIDSMKLTKSLESSRENIKILEKKPPAVIVDLMNYESYYTFRWVLDYGYIMYIDRGEIFWIRPDVYEKKLGDLERAKKNMFDTFPSQDILKIPYSLGNSIKTLTSIFSSKKEINMKNLKLEYNQIGNTGINEYSILNNIDPFFVIDLPETVSGNSFDFILIDLSSNYSEQKLKDLKIQLFWDSKELPLSENRTLRFNYGNGKLLVPIGIHPAWLYSNITKLRIDFENAKPGMEFKINKLEFLKLNRNRKK